MKIGIRTFLACILIHLAYPAAASAGNLYVRVDKGVQKAWVVLNGQTLFTWDVSTANERLNCGKNGSFKKCQTPSGVFFPVLFKEYHYSRAWKAVMPYSVFFDQDGDAFHAATASELMDLGRPASHGCVRLHPSHAKIFFELARNHHTVIEIVDGE